MLLVILVFTAYQSMPNFVTQRLLYEARERPSRTYSWKAFMLSMILVKIPWNSLAAGYNFPLHVLSYRYVSECNSYRCCGVTWGIDVLAGMDIYDDWINSYEYGCGGRRDSRDWGHYCSPSFCLQLDFLRVRNTHPISSLASSFFAERNATRC